MSKGFASPYLQRCLNNVAPLIYTFVYVKLKTVSCAVFVGLPNTRKIGGDKHTLAHR